MVTALFIQEKSAIVRNRNVYNISGTVYYKTIVLSETLLSFRTQMKEHTCVLTDSAIHISYPSVQYVTKRGV